MNNYYADIITEISSSYKMGYTTVGNQWTTSKMHALELAKFDISSIKYHWLEGLFDNIQWDIEPTISLRTMVDQHVKSIRESYDHVALWLSGGYDSFTILKAFIRNGLKIDELLVQQRDWHVNNVNLLDLQTALASAKVVKNTWLPNAKITIVNWGSKDTVIDFYKNHKLDWIYHSAGISRISQNSRAVLYEKNPHIKKSRDRPGNSIQLNGNDKPRVNLRDGKWYSARPDSTFYQESADRSLQFWFLPDLYLKQTWMMIKWLESLAEVSHQFVHDLQSHNTSNNFYMQWNLAMDREMPLFPFSWGTGHKQSFGNGIQSDEAQPLLNVIESSNPEIYHRYKIGAEYMESITQKIVQEGKHPVLLSKEYFIKDFETLKKENIDV